VSELEVDETRHLSWDESTERVIDAAFMLHADSRSMQIPIAIEGGQATEPVADRHGTTVGSIVRTWRAISGTLNVRAARLDEHSARSIYRLTADVTNTVPWHGQPSERNDAVRETMASAHIVLRVHGGAFISLMDPPEALAADAGRCRNEGLWPVLVGDGAAADTMLASPIILYDYPQIAPQSPGDMFDGGEIDQLLILNILALTNDERREMRESDPRARDILDRCASLSERDLMRLHGTMRTIEPPSTSRDTP
jgi:hypothetical protein